MTSTIRNKKIEDNKQLKKKEEKVKAREEVKTHYSCSVEEEKMRKISSTMSWSHRNRVFVSI